MATDKRDMRDPQAYGELLHVVMKNYDLTARRAASEIDVGLHGDVPSYNPTESMVDVTIRQRREELVARAAEGDKYALSMLTTGQPGDSDE